MKPFITFTVLGAAQTRGSKRSMPLYRGGKPLMKNGRVIINTVDDNPKSGDWMQEVRSAAKAAMDEAGLTLTDSPVCLACRFHFVRPKSHFGKKGLKASAPAYPKLKDLTKCVRGVEDAMTGIVWRDDSQVASQRTDKAWGEYAYVDVSVFLLPETVSDIEAECAAVLD